MGDEPAKPDIRVAEIAGRQHGVIAFWQLRTAGVSRKGVLVREEGGRIHRIHRGIYAVGHRALSTRGQWMAAVLACEGVSRRPGSAFLSHRSAANLWGLLDSGDGRIHVLIDGRTGRNGRLGIRLHWSTTLEPGDTTRRQRIPVTSPARTIRDLQTMRRRERPSPAELRGALRQASVLGFPIGDQEHDGTRSELERLFLQLCRGHRLPEPDVNVEVAGLEVDFIWPVRRLVVETDGYQFHRGKAAFDEDRRRGLKLRAQGLEVVRLSFNQVAEEPELVGRMLRDRLGVSRLIPP